MTHWVPPEFFCGECGGRVARWPMVNLLRQQILDWRHVTVPEGVEPHRAVLGTPAPHIPLLAPEPEEEGEVSRQAPPPEFTARPAMHEELPSSAVSIDKLAAAHGWTAEAWTWRGTLMDSRWHPSRVRSTVCLRFLRDGHGLVATWVTGTDGESWEFDEAWSLTTVVEPVSSPQLRKILSFPRLVCESCGRAYALHELTDSGPVCHASPNTNRP